MIKRVKRIIKKRILKQEDWSRWYEKNYEVPPEKCFQELMTSIPDHIDTVIDFGCAAGRNLALFNGKYKLFGVDLIDEKKMEWKENFQNLTYIKSKLQNFNFEHSMETFLCISHGTIMYCNPEEQKRFLTQLKEKGCKNFIFQEYDDTTLIDSGYSPDKKSGKLLGYAFSNPLEFEKKWYREKIPTWIKFSEA
jgi:SAM-dependent methyltransferase